MNVAITGASGFVGRRLTERLRKKGHTTKAISLRSVLTPDDLADCDAVVHLAGEPVAQRWTAAARRKILESREEGTRRLVAALRNRPPNVLVSASAVGYYGSRGDEVLTEQATPASDFLGQVAVAWEREALEAEKLGVRVVRLRIGMVLEREAAGWLACCCPFDWVWAAGSVMAASGCPGFISMICAI